jgi:thiol-disulfide isomerase/thioredoxin
VKKIILLLILILSTLIQAETYEYKLVTSEGSILKADLTEKGWTFENSKNRAVFLIVFGSNCPPCIKEMPRLIKAVSTHTDKLSIIAIEAQGYDTEQLAAFKAKQGINYTLLSRKEKENEYLLSDISTKLKWAGELPFLIAIDKHGEIQDTQMGEVSVEEIEELVKKLNQ